MRGGGGCNYNLISDRFEISVSFIDDRFEDHSGFTLLGF